MRSTVRPTDSAYLPDPDAQTSPATNPAATRFIGWRRCAFLPGIPPDAGPSLAVGAGLRNEGPKAFGNR